LTWWTVFTVYRWNYRGNLPTEFSVGNSIGNSVSKNDMPSFFLLCFILFSHGNSVGIYRGNISVGKISRKCTDENIPSVFLFVFINFLVVFLILWNCRLKPCLLKGETFWVRANHYWDLQGILYETSDLLILIKRSLQKSSWSFKALMLTRITLHVINADGQIIELYKTFKSYFIYNICWW
jgi:hypothetical protein